MVHGMRVVCVCGGGAQSCKGDEVNHKAGGCGGGGCRARWRGKGGRRGERSGQPASNTGRQPARQPGSQAARQPGSQQGSARDARASPVAAPGEHHVGVGREVDRRPPQAAGVHGLRGGGGGARDGAGQQGRGACRAGGGGEAVSEERGARFASAHKRGEGAARRAGRSRQRSGASLAATLGASQSAARLDEGVEDEHERKDGDALVVVAARHAPAGARGARVGGWVGVVCVCVGGGGGEGGGAGASERRRLARAGPPPPDCSSDPPTQPHPTRGQPHTRPRPQRPHPTHTDPPTHTRSPPPTC